MKIQKKQLKPTLKKKSMISNFMEASDNINQGLQQTILDEDTNLRGAIRRRLKFGYAN
jgi:hypothetical protein